MDKARGTGFICSKCGRYDAPHRKGKGVCKECEGKYIRTWKAKTGKQAEYNKKRM